MDDNRQIYASYLAHRGYVVDEASDGDEALAKVSERAPHAVVMDLQMPRLDGWEATRLIKSNPRTRSVIVIVVTGTASRQDLQRAWAAGADEVCVKPCLPQELAARIDAHLAKLAPAVKASSAGR